MKELLIIEPTKEQPRNSEGDIIELKDGRLCLIYARFTGGGGDHDAADLAMRTSADGGKTWSNDRIVVRNEGGCNVMSVTLRRLQDGSVALFYLRKNSTEDCRPVMRLSTDEAATWGNAVEVITDQIAYYVMNNDRVIQLSGGRLAAPVSQHTFPGQEEPDWNGEVMCYISDDSGSTWRRSQSTRRAYTPTGERLCIQEPGVVELKDGRVLMFSRCSGGSQYFCTSADGGDTWTKPEPSALAAPVSPATIERIPWSDGDLLCVWNDHTGRHPCKNEQRTPLCVAVSRDNGVTWSPSAMLEGNPDGWFCYISMTFVKNSVLLSYCAGDNVVGGLNRLKVVELSREWLDEHFGD